MSLWPPEAYKKDTTMNSYEWIMYAGIAVWAGIGLYVFTLARKQIALSRRIAQMTRLMDGEAEQ